MSDFPLKALARVPGLLIRLFFTFLRYKRRVNKSTRKLRKGLRKGGMSKEQANQLASRYQEDLSIRKFIKNNIGETGLPFFSNF